MLCEQILGTLSDEQFKNLKVDYVNIEWHEAFKKLHKKKTQEGRDLCEALVMTVDNGDVRMVAKVCYEIGNKHATLFRGEGDYQFITPLDLPIKALMEKLGVKVERKTVKFDFKKKISSSINAHTH